MVVDKTKDFSLLKDQERAKYIGEVYKKVLNGKVADVGSSESDLRKYVTGEYVGIDILDTPEIDITVDRERKDSN